jgi:predicted LPLAT superfamily acyltransferase
MIMSGFFYRLLIFLSRIFGLWIFDLISRSIAAGYFFLSPRRVAVGVRFYRALFPARSIFYHLWCTWRQFQNFTSIYMDRYLLNETGEITCIHTGWEYIDAALNRNTGGIIVMSHLGNWEIAAHLMASKWEKIRLILYMGSRAKAEIERIQKEDLKKKGIRIVAVEEGLRTPFDLMEGLRFIQSGGLVSMTGDLARDSVQRVVPAAFLGHEVQLPETPHLLAMLSGAPIFFFFSHRVGKNHYHITMSEPSIIRSVPRAERSEAMRRSAQRYADLLENNLRANPLEWYHFESFLGQRLK